MGTWDEIVLLVSKIRAKWILHFYSNMNEKSLKPQGRGRGRLWDLIKSSRRAVLSCPLSAVNNSTYRCLLYPVLCGSFTVLRSLRVGRHVPVLSPYPWGASLSHQSGPPDDQERVSGSFTPGGLRCDPDGPLDPEERRARWWIRRRHRRLRVLRCVGDYTSAVALSVLLQVGDGMSVSGGGLPDVYHTVQLHFHWGGPATNGSEHTVDRRRYPMEVQSGQ